MKYKAIKYTGLTLLIVLVGILLFNPYYLGDVIEKTIPVGARTPTSGDFESQSISTTGTGRFDGGIAIGNTPSSNSFLIETDDASDPMFAFRTSNTPHQINLYLDESMVTDKLRVAGQTAGIHTSLQLDAKDGQSASFYLYSGTAEGSYLSKVSDDNLQLTNMTSNKDIIFTVNKGGTDTEILRIDGSEGSLLMTSATTTDPTLTFKTVSPATAHEMDVYLDENMVNTELVFKGLTAAKHTNLNIRAVDGKNGTLYLTSGDNFSYIAMLGADNLQISNYEGDKDIIFNVIVDTTDTEIMRIDGSVGYIGMGTSTPAVMLDVEGTINSSGGYNVADVSGWTGTCPSASSTVVVGGIVTDCQ